MTDGITLTRPSSAPNTGGSDISVTITNDLELRRRVGRPQASIKPGPGTRGIYRDPPKPAADVFVISGEFVGSNAESDATKLQEDILLPPLGQSSLTLSFQNGLYGYSSDKDVFPTTDEQACRVSWITGETSAVRIDTLQLQVVDNSSSGGIT